MIGEDELRQLEGHVGRALAERSRAGLTILGHGEISIVLGWPFDRPRFACKRLPVFGETVRVLRYRDVFDRYLDALRQRGVPVLPSELEWVDRPDGSVAAYVVQPVLPAEAILPARLTEGPADARDRLVAAVIDTAVKAIDDRVGLDAQLSNWAEHDGDLVYFDVSTPLLRTSEGRAEIDLGIFLASFPWALRGALRRFVAPGVIGRYHEARSSLLDLAGNLVKEGLRPWLPAVLDAITRGGDHMFLKSIDLTEQRAEPCDHAEEVARLPECEWAATGPHAERQGGAMRTDHRPVGHGLMMARAYPSRRCGPQGRRFEVEWRHHRAPGVVVTKVARVPRRERVRSDGRGS